MKDISKLGTLFEYEGKLFEVVSYTRDLVIGIKPIRESDYKRCECGRPLDNQTIDYVHSAPILQDSIGKVYKVDDQSN